MNNLSEGFKLTNFVELKICASKFTNCRKFRQELTSHSQSGEIIDPTTLLAHPS